MGSDPTARGRRMTDQWVQTRKRPRWLLSRLGRPVSSPMLTKVAPTTPTPHHLFQTSNPTRRLQLLPISPRSYASHLLHAHRLSATEAAHLVPATISRQMPPHTFSPTFTPPFSQTPIRHLSPPTLAQPPRTLPPPNLPSSRLTPASTMPTGVASRMRGAATGFGPTARGHHTMDQRVPTLSRSR